ncbi:uncharacterized protein LOC103715092 isoform X2 [Phoenix dactylifera]|uniref:Uncharacterized protein LOC103715092 isoform X2 n=1 Tax=Phoenix dactylifera TaxID=42345 RepID=A0A8B7CKC8_PHODC|nr:uncharacterized protein LOC103715092 isoform X2 [Phoenix dactylifera]
MEEDDTEIQRRVLEEAFGESSDDEGPARSAADPFLSKKPIWESVNGIKGLWLCRGFLSIKQQSLLLSAIEREGWFSDGSHNQAMRFGDLPEWATELTRFVREAVCSGEVSFEASRESTFEDQYAEETCPLPLDLLWREPLFDQLISNVYEPGNMCACRFNALRGWNCHCLLRICLCDAFYTMRSRRWSHRASRGRDFLNEDSHLIESRLLNSYVWGSTLSLEA